MHKQIYNYICVNNKSIYNYTHTHKCKYIGKHLTVRNAIYLGTEQESNHCLPQGNPRMPMNFSFYDGSQIPISQK